jgi:hypothetical protein
MRILATWFARRTTFFPYQWSIVRCILRHMDNTQGTDCDRDVEFVKGCPLCEHSDPDLAETFRSLLNFYSISCSPSRRKKRNKHENAPVDIRP